jgi:F420-dependent oxidoreductase-like protein
MRFSLATSQEHTTWDVVSQLWAAADEIDLWESAWTGDHFYPFLGEPDGPCLEGWTTLTALAARTKRIRLGVLVSGMPHRHPAVLAKMAATVDIISGGRLLLGLGAAWNEMECDAYGIDLGAPSRRLDRFEEGVEMITRLLRDETTTFLGEHYRLRDARCSPKAQQHPHPPITIGGAGERRTARIVARWADHWDLGFTPPHDVPRKLAALAEHCSGLGRDPGEITISAVIRTRCGAVMRDVLDVTKEIERYAAAGCNLALVEAAPADAAQIPAVLDRLMATCRPLAEV